VTTLLSYENTILVTMKLHSGLNIIALHHPSQKCTSAARRRGVQEWTTLLQALKRSIAASGKSRPCYGVSHYIRIFICNLSEIHKYATSMCVLQPAVKVVTRIQ
jgi:hypothetical protein